MAAFGRSLAVTMVWHMSRRAELGYRALFDPSALTFTKRNIFQTGDLDVSCLPGETHFGVSWAGVAP